MKNRLKFLEVKKRKQIIHEKDCKDRIVLGVDECSVLYMNRNRFDNDYEASLEARQLADSIAKLSRAASIHMILATQKLDRQVLPTSVSENISGRLAFRANSLQGSLVVLGSKEASELPEIPGRAIWAFGTQFSPKKINLFKNFFCRLIFKIYVTKRNDSVNQPGKYSVYDSENSTERGQERSSCFASFLITFLTATAFKGEFIPSGARSIARIKARIPIVITVSIPRPADI